MDVKKTEKHIKKETISHILGTTGGWKDKQDTEALQQDLNSLQEWEKETRLVFHSQKCQILMTIYKLIKALLKYIILDIPLYENKEAIYWGVIIDDKLT